LSPRKYLLFIKVDLISYISFLKQVLNNNGFKEKNKQRELFSLV